MSSQQSTAIVSRQGTLGRSYLLQDGVVIDAAYPGGNVLVDSFDQKTVRLRPDLRDTSTWWFYWNFRVRGAAGRTLTFQFPARSPIGVRGPAVSTDRGRSWSWLGEERVTDSSFEYRFVKQADAVRFAFALPYQLANLQQFLRQYAGHPQLEVARLARSRLGRAIPQLRCGRIDGKAEHRVLFTARHHACETMASYALEGVLATVLDDTDQGRWFQQHVELLTVPLVDIDGVEEGDQGKNRIPHDHNRDYRGESIYPAVRALRRFVPQWSDKRLRLGLDMHCPYIRGGAGPGSNEQIFFVESPHREQSDELAALSSLLEQTQRGPLRYRALHNLAYGVSWNNAEHGIDRTSAAWMGSLEGIRLAATIELPYAHAGGNDVTAATARAFGADLARAIRRWLDS